MMKLSLLFFMLIFSCQDQNAKKENELMYKNVPATEMATLIETQPGEILDVRTLPEVNEAKLANSTHIDMMSSDFQQQLDKLDKNKTYYVYCRSGNRSAHAASLMISMGFKDVYNMSDGIIGWYQRGLPLER